MATNTKKRITKIASDEKHVDLHAGVYGSYYAHKFCIPNLNYHDGLELVLGKHLWASLGNPSKVRVTLTVVE